MRTHEMTRILAMVLCLNILGLPLPFHPSAAAKAEPDSFFTSFEADDPALTWENQAETSKGEKILTSGISSTDGGKSSETMRTSAGIGPDRLYTGKNHAGWTGIRALIYSGKVTGKNGGYAYNKIISLHLPVKADTRLSYSVAPLSGDGNSGRRTASYVSLDLGFSDGTYLHQIKKAVDEDGIRMTPAAQGKSGTLFMNQWNRKTTDIGKAAKGKTITKLMVAFHAPPAESGASFQGAIDDIRIGGKAEAQGNTSPVDRVNILRGTNSNRTFSRGNTVPAVAVPNGFASWSPAIDSSADRQLYLYNENNNPDNLPEIQSFSLSHTPNDQDGDRQTFQVMPSAFSGTPGANRLNRGLPFERKNETARPDYYGVTFTNGIKAEMTPASHSAIFRFTFSGKTGSLIFDNLDNHGGLTLSLDKRSIEGYSDVKNDKTGEMNRLFIYAEFNQPIISGSPLSGESRDRVTAFCQFDTSEAKTVTMRVGVSLIGVKQAKKNLDLEVGGKMTFDKVRKQAAREWNEQLGKVTVQGASPAEQTTLYSNLYRLFLKPSEAFENTGSKKKTDYRYASLDGKHTGNPTANETAAPIKEGKPYVSSDFAYSAQTVWPAYTLLEPERTGRLISGFLENEKESGWLPRSESGTWADLAFSDAYIKGVPGVDGEQLYRAILKDASVDSPSPGNGRPQQGTAVFRGYTDANQNRSINWTLSNSMNDFALGNLAAYLEKEQNGQISGGGFSYRDDSNYFLSRAQNYLTLFDRSTGFFNAKTGDGKWQQNGGTFDPEAWDNPQATPNGWNLSFGIPQDVQGLANLEGGWTGLSTKLDRFFMKRPSPSAVKKYGKAKEAASGNLGLFTLDNPSSAFTPYLYDYTGEPWKTQQKVRAILSHFYTGSNAGQGYLGDDTGAMLSGWYFFSAAGIYPIPGSSDYAIGAPYFKNMTIQLENGKKLVIRAPGVSDKNQYVQSVLFNGQYYSKPTIPHELIAQGGELTFQMGPKPSEWGASSSGLPNSLTPQSTNGSVIYPKPLTDLTDKQDQVDIVIKGGSAKRELLDNQSKTSAVFQSGRPSIDIRLGNGSGRVKMYTLTSHGENIKASDPKSWILYGSKDGTHWEVLDQRADETFKWRAMTRAFTIKNPDAFRYYRLSITEKSSSAPLAVAEYELLGYSDIADDFQAIGAQLTEALKKNRLTEAQAASLSHLLTEARVTYKKGQISDSIYYMQIYVQQVNALPFDTANAKKVRSRLAADAHAIVNLLSD
ncbi:glycoside hydrolase family 92 protein [Sporolactobacillus sp. THM7-7]|nr:glycoside hydrolase family 92 protein [Sporolactobacillus sp. THM7-7]